MLSHVNLVTGRQILPTTNADTHLSAPNAGMLMSDVDDKKLQKIIDDTLQTERSKINNTEDGILEKGVVDLSKTEESDSALAAKTVGVDGSK